MYYMAIYEWHSSVVGEEELNFSFRSTSGFTFITEAGGLNCEGKAA